MDQQPHTSNKWVLSEETIIVWLWCHDLGDVKNFFSLLYYVVGDQCVDFGSNNTAVLQQ